MITIDRYFGMAIPFVVGCGLVAELAAGGHDSRGARHRDATVPETASGAMRS